MGIRAVAQASSCLLINVSWFRLLEHQRSVGPVHSTGWHNGAMDDAAPVRITFERGSAAAVNRRFIGGFFAFAILFAGAAFYRPAIQAFAVGFPIYLILWRLRLRRASRPGWALVISEESLSLECAGRALQVGRKQAGAVRIERGGPPFGTRISLLIPDSAHKQPFRVEIDERDRGTIVETLRAKGWPVQNSE